MDLKLFDYDDKARVFDIGSIDDIAVILIDVITGDEVATVIYKDYSLKKFDSSDYRLKDYYDSSYVIYRYDSSDNVIDDPDFQNRKSSNW